MDQQLTIVDPDFVEEGLCVDKGEDHAYSRGGGLCLYQPLAVTGADQSKTRMLPLFHHSFTNDITFRTPNDFYRNFA